MTTRSHLAFLTSLPLGFAIACGGSSSPSASSTGAETAGAAAAGAPIVPGHEERAVGVYLARVDDAEGTARAEVAARLEALGVMPGGEGELACDQGASEALGLPPDAIVASLYFRTEAEARDFAARYGRVLGIAEVTTMCRD